MRNEIIFDSLGRPDVMVAFTPKELGLSAFLKGRKVKEYLISKYINTMIDDVPHSLPYQRPAVNVDFDEAIRFCESKGKGWHLITNEEWMGLAHWSRRNHTLPRGNTNYGKSYSHPEESGIIYEDGIDMTLTGSGPMTWNHDHTAEGVTDLCGNVWEHVGGIRFLNGQPQVIPNNEAAVGADQSPDSKEWTAIYTPDGDPVYYNVKDGEIVLQSTAPDEKDYDGVPFCDLHERADMDVPNKLIELGLYPAPGYKNEKYFWLNTEGEHCVSRGGGWGNGPGAGVFCLSDYSSRAYSASDLGFRSALVRYEEEKEEDEKIISENRLFETSENTLSEIEKIPRMLVQELVGNYLSKKVCDLSMFDTLLNQTSEKEIQDALNKVLKRQ